jgi:Ca2+-binding RTX toxin-like protein
VPAIRTTVVGVVLCAALIAPASAHALVVFIDPSKPLDLRLDDPTGVADQVGISSATPTAGKPDLVIGDLTAGIQNPLPNVCQRVSSTIIRCPLTGFTSVTANLGGGNDTWGIGTTTDIDAAALQLYTAYLGAGNDVAEGGPVSNQLYGGAGRDEIKGGPKNDGLFGGAQNDLAVGLGGDDLFQCGKGNRDRFNDGPGRDRVNVATCEIRVKTLF